MGGPWRLKHFLSFFFFAWKNMFPAGNCGGGGGADDPIEQPQTNIQSPVAWKNHVCLSIDSVRACLPLDA